MGLPRHWAAVCEHGDIVVHCPECAPKLPPKPVTKDRVAELQCFLHDRYTTLLGHCPGGCTADAQDFFAQLEQTT